MTHRRKTFIVYHPDHKPLVNSRYKMFHSKRQAWKQAYKWGEGTGVMEDIHTHPAPFKSWVSSRGGRDWTIESNSKECS